MTLPRFHTRSIDPGGVTDGVYLLAVSGGQITGLSPYSGGGGGGGGGAVFLRATDLGVNFVNNTAGAWVTITGWTITITPSVDGVLSMDGRFRMFRATSVTPAARWWISPAPEAPSQQYHALVCGALAGNEYGEILVLGSVKLAAGITYTVSVDTYQPSGTGLTINTSDFNYCELTGVFLPS